MCLCATERCHVCVCVCGQSEGSLGTHTPERSAPSFRKPPLPTHLDASTAPPPIRQLQESAVIKALFVSCLGTE